MPDEVTIINNIFEDVHIACMVDPLLSSGFYLYSGERITIANLYLAAGYTVDDFVNEVTDIAKSGVEKILESTKSFVFYTNKNYVSTTPQRGRFNDDLRLSKCSRNTLEVIGNELYEIRVYASATFLEDMLFNTVSRGNR